MADIGSILGDAGKGAALGSVVPGVGTLIGGIGGAALGIASGLFGKKKANNILSQNPFPNQEIPPEVLANQQIAQGAAQEGMPAEQYQAAQKDIQRNQAAALSAAQDRRGGVQAAEAIQQTSNDATGKLNSESAQMRRQNIAQLLGVNNQVASWKDKLFDANQRAKYTQNYNYGMGLLGQSNQNILSGADRLLGTAAGVAGSGMFGGSANAANGSSAAPAPYMYNPGLANTAGGYSSPAGGYGSINPNSAPLLIGQ